MDRYLDQQLAAVGDERLARRVWHTDYKITYPTTAPQTRFFAGSIDALQKRWRKSMGVERFPIIGPKGAPWGA